MLQVLCSALAGGVETLRSLLYSRPRGYILEADRGQSAASYRPLRNVSPPLPSKPECRPKDLLHILRCSSGEGADTDCLSWPTASSVRLPFRHQMPVILVRASYDAVRTTSKATLPQIPYRGACNNFKHTLQMLRAAMLAGAIASAAAFAPGLTLPALDRSGPAVSTSTAGARPFWTYSLSSSGTTKSGISVVKKACPRKASGVAHSPTLRQVSLTVRSVRFQLTGDFWRFLKFIRALLD